MHPNMSGYLPMSPLTPSQLILTCGFDDGKITSCSLEPACMPRPNHRGIGSYRNQRSYRRSHISHRRQRSGRLPPIPYQLLSCGMCCTRSSWVLPFFREHTHMGTAKGGTCCTRVNMSLKQYSPATTVMMAGRTHVYLPYALSSNESVLDHHH